MRRASNALLFTLVPHQVQQSRAACPFRCDGLAPPLPPPPPPPQQPPPQPPLPEPLGFSFPPTVLCRDGASHCSIISCSRRRRRQDAASVAARPWGAGGASRATDVGARSTTARWWRSRGRAVRRRGSRAFFR